MDYRNHNQSHGGSVHLLYTVSGLLVLKMLIKDLLWFVTLLHWWKIVIIFNNNIPHLSLRNTFGYPASADYYYSKHRRSDFLVWFLSELCWRCRSPPDQATIWNEIRLFFPLIRTACIRINSSSDITGQLGVYLCCSESFRLHLWCIRITSQQLCISFKQNRRALHWVSCARPQSGPAAGSFVLGKG